MAYQDFTTYTEVDSGSDITVSSSAVTVSTMTENANSSVYKDFTAGFFTTFHHRFKVTVLEANDLSDMAVWHMSNISAATCADMDTADRGLAFCIRYSGTASQFRFALKKFETTGTIIDYSANIAFGATRYIEVIRTSTTFTAEIYTDANYSVLSETLSIDLDSTAFQYLGVAGSQDGGGTNTYSFTIENLEVSSSHFFDNPSKYSVQVRNKAGNLIRYLTPWVQSLSWEWRRIGGCGNCSMKLAVPYRDIDFNVLDDIQIRVKDGSTTKLVYRGFVSSISPALSKSQDITVNIKGYFDLLKTIIVQDTGIEKEYASDYVYEIVNDIVTNFIEANSSITAPASVYEDTFTVDAIAFKTSVAAALDTLANLLGDVEYGVDENLEFYWQQESDTVNHKFFVGIDIEKLNRTKDYSDLVNKIYFEGAKDETTGVFKKTATSSGSISAYYLAEAILTNSAISTDTVADAYLTVLLQQKSSPKYKLSFDVPNTAKRLEDNIPMGKVSIYDDDYDRGPATKTVWGTTGNGGSNKKWGTIANSGDGALWGGGGGAFQQQVEYVQYELSDTDGRFNLKIYTGGSLDKFAAKVKQLELLTADLRQRG